jgi:hypothetical protein
MHYVLRAKLRGAFIHREAKHVLAATETRRIDSQFASKKYNMERARQKKKEGI